jgi:formin 2
MECVEVEANELLGMMEFLPTKDESSTLRSYLPPADAPQSEIDEAIDKLRECEQYMAVMLDVPDAKEKLQCMLFRVEFEQQVDSIRDGTKLLIVACDSVLNSERLRKLLKYVLKLGNALNTNSSGEEAIAITLDSLPKLAEVCQANLSFMTHSTS